MIDVDFPDGDPLLDNTVFAEAVGIEKTKSESTRPVRSTTFK